MQKLGGRSFDPVESEKDPGHYLSFIETDAKYRLNSETMSKPDENLPSRDKELGRCTLSGCKGFSFFNKKDRDWHYKIVHGGKRRVNAVASENVAGLVTKCQVCGLKFATQYKLKQHKKTSGHEEKRGGGNKICMVIDQIEVR